MHIIHPPEWADSTLMCTIVTDTHQVTMFQGNAVDEEAISFHHSPQSENDAILFVGTEVIAGFRRLFGDDELALPQFVARIMKLIDDK